jgi:hypothetical protein
MDWSVSLIAAEHVILRSGANFMERCLHCNSVLTITEKVCPNCHTPKKQSSWSLGDTLQWLGRLVLYSASFTMLFKWLFPDSFQFGAVLVAFAAGLALFIRR